ncbi:probable tocopherol O-methyltransferase, chloroplastic [Tanacetum coccineum]
MSKVYVGCGIGVCATHLSRKYGAKCSGLTINHVPAERAHALAVAQGLSNKSNDDECETVNGIKTVDVPLKDNLADAIDDKIRLEFQKFDKGIRQCEGTMPEFHDGERQSIRVDHPIVSVVGNFAVAAFSKACTKEFEMHFEYFGVAYGLTLRCLRCSNFHTVDVDPFIRVIHPPTVMN